MQESIEFQCSEQLREITRYTRRCHIAKQVLFRLGPLVKHLVRTARPKRTLRMHGQPYQGTRENQET